MERDIKEGKISFVIPLQQNCKEVSDHLRVIFWVNGLT